MRLERWSCAARSRAFPSVSPLRTTPGTSSRAAALQRLTADPRIRSTHIHIKVSRGHLTLTGHARHEAESAAALEDVSSLTGVVGVANQIKVRERKARVQ
jgi:osmotically-inducible protein OsmY